MARVDSSSAAAGLAAGANVCRLFYRNRESEGSPSVRTVDSFVLLSNRPRHRAEISGGCVQSMCVFTSLHVCMYSSATLKPRQQPPYATEMWTQVTIAYIPYLLTALLTTINS